jgi:multidrug efflux system membrane fusion protein
MNTLVRDRVRTVPHRRLARRLAIVAVLLLLAAGAYWRFGPQNRSVDATQAAGAEKVPVLLAAAQLREVPIYLDGLGTVQASQTVTVKPQVDGTLVQVGFREGQDVKQGDLLARIDPRTYQAAVDQAVAKKQQDQANLTNAKVDLARYQRLAATAYTSAQQSDTQRATVAQLEAQLAQDQAQIDTARTQLSFTTITAPIDGRTGIRLVDQGNVVHATDTTGIVVLTTLKPIAVVFTLPQQQLPDVAAAMAACAPEVLALPQSVGAPDRAALDRGSLAVLDNQVDSATGTIKLKAMFPNHKLQLWPGAFVTVRLRLRTEHNALVVPQAAVQRGPNGAYVYVADHGVAQRRAVHVGAEDLFGSIVEQGLAPGDKVVVDGAARLTDGAPILVAQPPGTPSAAASAP